MPRNASGTYSLPSGNPVSSGTLIDANWANNTLNDLANEVTDSLSRSAEGGMLAPLRLTDGVQATPSLAFTNEPSSGLYRAGTNDAWFVSGGNQVMQFTSSGVVGRLAAGAVGTPSLAFSGDLNTGLWSPAADTLAASTGGSERLRVDSSGNVGIGTASPGAYGKFVAVGTGDVGNFDTASGATGLALFENGTGRARIRTLNGSDGLAFLYGATEGMRLDSSGNLGIGTASPSQRLTVAGNINTTNALLESTGANVNFGTVTAGYLAFLAGSGAERMRLDSSGNLGIGTASPGSRLEVNGTSNLGGTAAATRIGLGVFSAGVASITTSGANDLHVGTTNASAAFRIYTNNSERFQITGDGNYSIGNSQFGGGVRVIGIVNATTVPTTNPTGGGVLYVDAGALKYRGSSGTVTTIANA